MGRKTWESIPAKFRPLSGRTNVVLTRNEDAVFEGAITASSLQAATSLLATGDYAKNIESVFIIGGAQAYKEAMSSTMCEEIYLTRVSGEYECDTFIPLVEEGPFECKRVSNSQTHAEKEYRFEVFSRKAAEVSVPGVVWSTPPRHEEYQYLDLIKEIMEHGVLRGDRTGTGTLSLFGRTMRYSLRDEVLHSPPSTPGPHPPGNHNITRVSLSRTRR